MMAFCVVADNIHDCYVYLFKKERLSRPSLCLTTFCRLVKNWDKEITENVVWPKISSTIAKLKPFVNFNITECKLIIIC